MFRTFLVVALAATLFVAAKDSRLLKETGFLSSCDPVGAWQGPTGDWWACDAGRIDGKPDLSGRSCVHFVTVESTDFWSCPVEERGASA